MRRTDGKRVRGFALPNKKAAAALLILCLAALLLAGCGFHVNVNHDAVPPEELLVNQDLIGDLAQYDPEGKYTLYFYYEKGGFQKMDLSQAYVACYSVSFEDQLDSITGGNTGEYPPLPEDAQLAFDEAMGFGELEKIAVIKIKTLDDYHLSVSFTDKHNPLPGKEYFFIIPNMGLAGSVAPD
ncbi:MAG: hypothetical protein IJQ42_07525 [Oscillospiraceae bacterium]|nr:hypothetical protein [Oscillospiraceae bacterium]